MKASALIAIVLTLAGAADPAAAAGVDGRWRLTTTLSQFGISYALDCDLHETAGALSGRCKDAAGNLLPVRGTTSGGAVQFSYVTDIGGVQAWLRYSGALGPDGRLTGSVAAGELRGTFVARPQ